MRQIELDRKMSELNAEYESRRLKINAREAELKKGIKEARLEAEQKISDCRKLLQNLSLEYQALKEDIANRRASLLIQAENELEY